MSDATFKMDGQFIGTENMEEEVNKFYIELPGDECNITCIHTENKVNVVCHLCRYLCIKIEDKNVSSFRVTCGGETFYLPKEKKQVSEYTFSPGDRVDIHLRRSFQGKILIEAETQRGTVKYYSCVVSAIDSLDMSGNIKASPAPICIGAVTNAISGGGSHCDNPIKGGQDTVWLSHLGNKSTIETNPYTPSQQTELFWSTNFMAYAPSNFHKVAEMHNYWAGGGTHLVDGPDGIYNQIIFEEISIEEYNEKYKNKSSSEVKNNSTKYLSERYGILLDGASGASQGVAKQVVKVSMPIFITLVKDNIKKVIMKIKIYMGSGSVLDNIKTDNTKVVLPVKVETSTLKPPSLKVVGKNAISSLKNFKGIGGIFYLISLGIDTWDFYTSDERTIKDFVATLFDTTLKVGTAFVMASLIESALLTAAAIAIKMGGFTAIVAGGLTAFFSAGIGLIIGGIAVAVIAGLIAGGVIDGEQVKSWFKKTVDYVEQKTLKEILKETADNLATTHGC